MLINFSKALHEIHEIYLWDTCKDLGLCSLHTFSSWCFTFSFLQYVDKQSNRAGIAEYFKGLFFLLFSLNPRSST